MEALVYAGIREILLVVQFRSEKIREKIGSGERLGCRITYVRQERLGGTADAVDSCREKLREDSRFLVIYGDDYYHKDAIKRFVSVARRKRGIFMGTAETEDVYRFGSVEVSRGRVVDIREKVSAKRAGLVNAGLYMMDPSIFPAIEKTKRSSRGELELTDSIRSLTSTGSGVHAANLGSRQWCGISYPWDLLEANQRALESEKRVVRGKIERGAEVSGTAIIEAGSVVKSGSYLEGPVHIGGNCVVGPNAYLRPYSSVGNRVKIGAACEVKNSIIMDDAKVPHLSYVGDSIIGEGSTLGAGTITANLRFDEAEVKSRVKGEWVNTRRKKLGAVLGEDVRTGINVSIFPGVKIGRGVWIGPGAIIDRDVPSGARVRAT